MENFTKLAHAATLSFNNTASIPETYNHESLVLDKKIDKNNNLNQKRFIAVVRLREDLIGFLEAVFICKLLKKRNENITTSILIHKDNQYLAKSTNLFNRIYSSLNSNDKINKVITKENANTIFIPSHDVYAQLISSFSITRLRTTGFSQSFISRILGLQKIDKNKKNNIFLKNGMKGLEGNIEKVLPQIVEKIKIEEVFLPKRNYIWLSIFEEHNLNRDWPIEYFARLIRLIQKLDLDIVVPLIDFKTKGQHLQKSISTMHAYIDYLKQISPTNLLLINEASPELRAAGMQNALAIVGAEGPEIILASMLNKPFIVLHDMRSHKIKSHSDPIFKNYWKNQRKELVSNNNFVKKVSWNQDLSNVSQLELGRYMSTSVSPTQKHITPIVEKCIEDCDACEYNSCVEYISPEQVYENLKKILFPNN